LLYSHENDDDDNDSSTSSSSSSSSSVLTSALLRISYDGSRFTGWSSANNNNNNNNKSHYHLTYSRRNRRKRGLVGKRLPKGFVRSVEGVLQANLAKIYGNIDPNRIVVEGCSRTDRGVHATSMMAQIYCLQEGILLADKKEHDDDDEDDDPIHRYSIPGKRKPHPVSAYDTSYFEPIPMNGNLSRLAFALNRMRPPDLQITGIAPVPSMPFSTTTTTTLATDQPIFHPSLTCRFKTYEYKLSAGPIHDPTMENVCWHVHTPSVSSYNDGKAKSDRPFLDMDAMQSACTMLRGTHDFVAFQGAPRGLQDKRKRQDSYSTVCTLENVRIVGGDKQQNIPPGLQTFRIIVTGDRFLYKMVRFLVGSIVAVGQGKVTLQELEDALMHGSWEMGRQRQQKEAIEDNNNNNNNNNVSKRVQFQCAPAHGLVLRHVDYGEDISIDWKPLRDSK